MPPSCMHQTLVLSQQYCCIVAVPLECWKFSKSWCAHTPHGVPQQSKTDTATPAGLSFILSPVQYIAYQHWHGILCLSICSTNIQEVHWALLTCAALGVCMQPRLCLMVQVITALEGEHYFVFDSPVYRSIRARYASFFQQTVSVLDFYLPGVKQMHVVVFNRCCCLRSSMMFPKQQ